MSDVDGKNILQGLRQTREFLKQVSLLMQSAEEIVSNKGWREIAGSRQSSNITSDLYDPDRWMPRDVYRLYVSAEADAPERDIIIYLAVHLDQNGAWGGFKEPWVTCGLCQFLPGKRPDKVRPIEYVKAHLENKQEPNGEFRLYDHQETKSDWYTSIGLCREKSMALPLVEVRSAADLSAKVVNPLLQKVEELLKAE